MPSKPIPTELLDYLHYDPQTGILTWVKSPGRSVREGAQAGTLDAKGYLRFTFKRQGYKVHRVAWLIMTGEDPGENEVDHRNLQKSDNTWKNLRLLTPSQQHFNKGALGYHWSKKRQAFRSVVKIDKVNLHLGFYFCPLLARIAYYDELVKRNLNFCQFYYDSLKILGRPDLAHISFAE